MPADIRTFRFEAVIQRYEGFPTEVVCERTYGQVRVTAEWPNDLSTRRIRVVLTVSGDRDARNAPSYIELFFHDVFLLLNLAAPGSFGGRISITGGPFRARDIELNPRVFEYAAPLEQLQLAQVISWYDSLGLATQQLASEGVSGALFELLHLARGQEEEEHSIVRLASAAERLIGRPNGPRRLFELRDEIVRGQQPVFHPMLDDALDPRVEDATQEWVEVADAAANAVIGTLQKRIRNATRV